MLSSPALPSPVRRGLARAAFAASVLTAASTSLSCKHASTSEQPLAPTATASDDGDASGAGPDGAAEAGAAITVVVTDLPAIFAAIEALSERWVPDGPLDLEAELQAIMLAVGYPPRLWEHLDPAGPHGVYVRELGAAAPAVALTVRVTDPGRLADTIGAQPNGANQWSLATSGGADLTLRAEGNRLDFGSSATTIDDLHRKLKEVPGSSDIRLRIDDPPRLARDRVKRGPPRLDELFESMTTLDWSVDLRPDADLRSIMTATFDALPESRFVGRPITEPTALERRLGHGALAIATTSLPEDLGPWHELAGSAQQREQLGQADSLLGGTGREVVWAVHPDGPAHVTVLAGLEVEDTDRFRATVVGVLGKGLVDAGATHRATKLGGVAADTWTLPVPDAKAFAGLVTDKGKITVAVAVHEGLALIAVGPGSKPRLTASLRPPEASTKPGSPLAALGLLQRSLDGCQLCLAIAPGPALAYLVRVLESDGMSDDALQGARRASRILGRLGDLGALTAGVRMDERTFRMGGAIPGALLYAPVADARAMTEAFAKLGKFEGREVVDQTTLFADQLCACKDMACAQVVTKEMAAWAEAHEDAQGTKSQAKEIEAQTKRIVDCMTELATRGR